MVVTASPDTYYHLLEYGIRKSRLRIDRLVLQAFMAGVYVGLAGHCCTNIAGGFSVQKGDPMAVPKALQKLIYGMLFPVAFIAIIWTGAELFTGNTMTMLVCILEKRIKVIHLVINWVSSLFGNWLGALFVAYFLSHLTGALEEENVSYFLFSTAKEKVSHSFSECFLRAVGCNTFVCLAVWFVIATDDGAGKILALWFPILAFCVGGYEHIIANFYTLQAALIAGAPVSLGDVIVKNFIPTLLGNLVGGCLLIGAVCWYNFYPTVGVRDMAADVSGALQVGAIEELVPSGDEEVNKGKGSPAPSFGEAGGVFSAAQWPPAGQRVKRYSVVSRDGNLTAAFDSSATILLPKESFGGQHFLMGAQQGPFPKPPKESSKPFSLLPGFFGGADQRPQQTKASADYNREAPSACQIPQHSDPQRQTNTITEQADGRRPADPEDDVIV